jgi:hypothetical protein
MGEGTAMEKLLTELGEGKIVDIAGGELLIL